MPPVKHDVASSAIRLPGQVPLHLTNRHAHRIVVRRVRPNVALLPLINRRAQGRELSGKRGRHSIGQPLLQVEGWGAHARIQRGTLWRLRPRRGAGTYTEIAGKSVCEALPGFRHNVARRTEALARESYGQTPTRHPSRHSALLEQR